ncbi:hypothetical protein ACFY3V_38620 [Streptosporangium sp. NPDC000095]|uniref:hypothetical protein n=1 Tax=Streptosporangium sp. NPDC000095 TaxID=3366184 RepID=UPI00369483C8
MKRSTIAVLVAAAVRGGALIVPVAFFVLNYGCDADDGRLVDSLGILDVRPASATPQEGRDSSCDERAFHTVRAVNTATMTELLLETSNGDAML